MTRASKAAAEPAPTTTASVPPQRKRRVAHTATQLTKDGPEVVIKDAERTRAEIIGVATKEFSQRGYSGGRINEIAERTRTSKRMIYYYFGGKEGLYRAVLFEHYRRLRENDRAEKLEDVPPLEALATLTRLTFDWYVDHAGEVPLVMVENIHHARHISSMPDIGSLNSSAIELVRLIYDNGVEQGVMRPGVRPIDIYLAIASASFFNVSNRYTFAAIFGHDMSAKGEVAKRRSALVDTVLRYVAADPSALPPAA